MPKDGSPSTVKANPGVALLSGALSGFASCVILQPLDLLKTRLQQGNLQFATAGPSSSVGGKTLRAAKLVLANDGLQGFWRGTTPTVARNVPGVALYFASLNQLRSILPNSVAGNLLAGATARSSVGLVLMPMTVIKTRMESSIYHSTGIRAAMNDILKTHGFRGLFAGFWPTTLRDAPTAGLFLVSYEQIRGVLSRSVRTAQTTIDASAGAAAAGFATLVTAPFDTIKTRQQLRPSVYTSILQTGRLLYLNEGLTSFFRGVSLRCIRKAASSGIAWSLYEGLVRRWA